MPQDRAAHREYMRRRRALMRAALPAPVSPVDPTATAQARGEPPVAGDAAQPPPVDPTERARRSTQAAQAGRDAILRRIARA